MREPHPLHRLLDLALHPRVREPRTRAGASRRDQDVDGDAGVLGGAREGEVQVVVDEALGSEAAGLGASGAEGGEEDCGVEG